MCNEKEIESKIEPPEWCSYEELIEILNDKAWADIFDIQTMH